MRNRFVLAVAALSVVAAMLPPSVAQAAPRVELLNPSDYSTNKVVSMKKDADETYHLVAWVAEVPSNPLVEFEISNLSPLGGNPDTVTGTRVGTTDTWEAEYTIAPGTTDGSQYRIEAILYTGFTGPGSGTEVARSNENQVTTINNSDVPPPPQSNTVEIAYPTDGGGFGFFQPKEKPGAGVVSGFASMGTRQVRVLYTVTAPGSDPEWKACGSGPVAADFSWRVRCTLDAADAFAAVRAVAAVANSTPSPGPAQAPGDESGDAHRVFPYAQIPTDIKFDESQIRADPNKCQKFTFEVDDQQSIPIAGINVDVHAKGPSDQLKFAEMTENAQAVNSPFQAPDQGHTGKEPTAKCTQTDPDNSQAEHNVAGAPDIKHIESKNGTNNAGQFIGVLRSSDTGGTQISAWADADDDDSQGVTEATGSAQIGWGEAPPPPEETVIVDPSDVTTTVGECTKFTAAVKQNGDPVSGKNVDIHITDPQGVAFCDPGGSTTRPPDTGNHSGEADNDQANTFHNEGETSPEGEVVFGVTSSGTGDTKIVVWADDVDNDVRDSTEPIGTGSITWQEEGERSVSLHSSKRKAKKGSRVTFSGGIDGADACKTGQSVKLQSRKSGGRFHGVRGATTETNDQGQYTMQIVIHKTKQYRVVAPNNGPCDKATSNQVTVRAT